MKRWFHREGDVLHRGDKTYVLSNQRGKRIEESLNPPVA